MSIAIPVEHEKPVPGPSNRSFGLTVGGILLALGGSSLLFADRVHVPAAVMVAVGVPLLLAALVAPFTLTVPNRLWMKLGEVLFVVVSPIVMLAVYLVAFVPMGIAMRLAGHDPLTARLDRAKPSYWSTRTGTGAKTSSMTNQF